MESKGLEDYINLEHQEFFLFVLFLDLLEEHSYFFHQFQNEH